MKDILMEGRRLRLRRATEDDLKYIIALQYDPENLKFIVPFNEEYHKQVIASDNSANLDVIVEEIETKTRAGYFMVRELDNIFKSVEVTHVIIGRKGLGYGREALKLLLKWCFEIKNVHRAWLDCKTYNEIALHLYESVGMVREGVFRECIACDGLYEDLIILSMLDREYKKIYS